MKKESDPVKISYKPKMVDTEITIAFIKFNNQKYGIQILFEKAIKATTMGFNMGIDELSLVLSDQQELKLKHFTDSNNFNPNNNTISFQTTYVFDSDQFDLLKLKMVEKIVISFKADKKTITIKENSRDNILSITKSF